MQAAGTVPHELPSYPVNLLYCRNCELVQLGLSIDPKLLFPPSYPYTSGTTRILRDNFAALYRECREIAGLGADDLIVDIGSNEARCYRTSQRITVCSASSLPMSAPSH